MLNFIMGKLNKDSQIQVFHDEKIKRKYDATTNDTVYQKKTRSTEGRKKEKKSDKGDDKLTSTRVKKKEESKDFFSVDPPESDTFGNVLTVLLATASFSASSLPTSPEINGSFETFKAPREG